jgi:hypothetical protein
MRDDEHKLTINGTFFRVESFGEDIFDNDFILSTYIKKTKQCKNYIT